MSIHIRRGIRTALLFFLFTKIIPAASCQTADHWESVILRNDVFHYLVPVSEPPSGWSSLGFDDSSWLTGKGNIGYGEVDDSTVLTAGVTSLYLRINFNIPDRSAISAMKLYVDYDDGFVAYLNGHEIARANLGTPGDHPPFNSFALSSHESVMYSGGQPTGFDINADTLSYYLLQGNNVLSLQVHNNTIGSSDLASSTFLFAGISNTSSYFRPLPQWFMPPFSEETHLPVISINTNGQAIPDYPRIPVYIKVVDNGPDKINKPGDQGTDYDGMAGMKLRGQSSQMFPKKPYGIELWKTSSIDSAASLLGMPQHKDWVLYPPYSDKTMMRNAITYFFGSKMGTWQPRCRYCVLYLNGEYLGIYILMEHIERDENRVNISGLGPQDISGDDVTGGYIVKMDKIWNLSPESYFTVTPGIKYPNSWDYIFTYVYPRPERINVQQKAYIKSFLTQAQNVLAGYNFKDPDEGAAKYFDYGSFADNQIMQELANNVDGYRLSQYFYKQKSTHGGRLFAGPLWDIDLGYANATYYDYNYVTYGWYYIHVAPDWEHPMYWWDRLMQDPVYVRRFVTRWRELRQNEFRTENFMHFIDSTVTYLGTEVARNYQKWPIIGTYVWPNYYIGPTYEADVNFLKNWITDRLAWMDQATGITSDLYNKAFADYEIISYPNPVKDNLTIALSTSTTNKLTFSFSDLFGRKIYETTYVPALAGNQEITINLSALNTGLYLLSVSRGNEVLALRKIIKH